MNRNTFGLVILMAVTVACLTHTAVHAVAAPKKLIPQDQMDALHNFFSGYVSASDGLQIVICEQPTANCQPPVGSPDAQKMAQMLSVCQVQIRHDQYNQYINVGGPGCPVAYFKVVTTRPPSNGSTISSTVERNRINALEAQILTRLSEYSTSTGATTTAGTGNSYSAQGRTNKRIASADKNTIVMMQNDSTVTGVTSTTNGSTTQTVTSDKENYLINFGATQSYTAGISTSGSQSACTLNGTSSSCADFDYIMGQSTR